MSGLYTGASGIMANMEQLNIIANNITNANTTAYKGDTGTLRTFHDLVMQEQSNNQQQIIGKASDEVYLDQVYTNFQQGPLVPTGRNLDMALNDGTNSKQVTFFEVSNGKNVYLTRDGQFQMNAKGQLVTSSGLLVLGQNGKPLTIPSNQNITVQNDGTIINDNTHKTIGKLALTSVNKSNTGFLEKQGNGLYSVMNITQFNQLYGSAKNLLASYANNITVQKTFPNVATLKAIAVNGKINVLGKNTGSVMQDTLENSNVSLTQEFTALIQNQQNVSLNERAEGITNQIQQQDASQITKYV